MGTGITNRAFPGAVLLALHKDSTLYEKTYGFHTYDSVRAVKSTDIYDLASITKVTAATLALMGLYEDGLLDLDKQVVDYMPEIKGKRGKVTVREILAHQSGWRSWIAYHVEIRDKKGGLKKKYVATEPSEKYDWKLADNMYLRTDFYETIKQYIAKAEFNPEQGYVYSGMFFYLIPEIVKNQTGQDFDEYLRDRFYDPLGAATTVFNPLDTYGLDDIVPTEVDTFFRMKPLHGYVHDEGAIMMRGVSGNAGLFSNARDLS
ncbi:MAG: serine hydrolase, partial [Bacteroidota bacterium]